MTAVTAVTVGIRIARVVTAVIIVTAVASFRHAPREDRAIVGAVAAVTTVTGQAFVTRPGGGMGDRGRRDRRDHGSSVPVAIAVAAVTAVIAELRPAVTFLRWGAGLRCRCVHLDRSDLLMVHPDRVIVVSGMHFAPRPEMAAALNQNV
jgi:hypothetical protein